MSIVHTPVKATDLRPGDVIRIGRSENYVIVASAGESGGRVHVTIYDGCTAGDGPYRSFAPGDDVQLSRRGYRPLRRPADPFAGIGAED